MTETADPAAPAVGWLDRLAKLAIAVAGTALVGVVIVQAWQVIARYVLNDSPGWTEPVTHTSGSIPPASRMSPTRSRKS